MGAVEKRRFERKPGFLVLASQAIKAHKKGGLPWKKYGFSIGLV